MGYYILPRQKKSIAKFKKEKKKGERIFSLPMGNYNSVPVSLPPS